MRAATWTLLTSLFCGVTAGYSDAEERVLLWGDTHLHTSYSFDAFLNGNQSADPETAYRYARGFPVVHPYNRTRVQIGTPLDFLVISDHAEFFGGIRDIYNEGVQVDDPNIFQRAAFWWAERQIRDAIDSGEGPAFFADLLPEDGDPTEAAAQWSENIGDATPPGAATSKTNAWQRARDMAERYNEPGTFTTLLGWEWSSIPGSANLHRVVFTDADGKLAGEFEPFGSTVSPHPKDLWAWLDETSKRTGARFLAIPHNSNISKGTMFAEQTLAGEPMDADYIATRRRFEPVVEITQIKGDSEAHPDLSPDDEFADFELYPWYIANVRARNYKAGAGDYIRSALKTGLKIEQELGSNPYQFGVIGSTDSHTGLSSAEEPNFWGKMARDSIPENKQGNALADGPTGWTMQAGGLAAVWASENTRSAILEAFERREVYATTGPRIRLRMAAGDFPADPFGSATSLDEALAGAVAMGGELRARERAPTLLIEAEMDPVSGALDRIQVIKGWIDADGKTHERVFNAAWSGRETASADALPAVGSTVDLKTGEWDNSIGAPSLRTLWQDPSFEPEQAAFYYVRVLEIPTPRHSHLDAIALGLEAAAEGTTTIQERAYSSPIWYQP